MINVIETAFAELDAKLIASDQEWAIAKLDTVKEAVKEMEEGFKAGNPEFIDLTAGYGRFDRSMAVTRHFGSKGIANLLTGSGRDVALSNMRKNTLALISKRNAQIVKALTKKGITELPAFTLSETSDGYEGTFNVAGHVVTIQTILAGGYNVQRLHVRTLVTVKPF